jgi:hypothetical protein
MFESFFALLNKLNGSTLDQETTESIIEQDTGSLNRELVARLQETVKSVRETGRKGNVTLRLKISHGGMKQIEVEPEVKSSKPKVTAPTSVLFADDEGRLYDRDPEQFEMDFRDVNGSGQDLRAVRSNDS